MKSTKRISTLQASALTGSRRIAIGLGAVALGMALALPAPAQEESWIPQPTVATMTEAGDAVSTDAGTASVGASAPAGELESVQAGPEYQGANPANISCDSQQGQARDDCLKALTAGGGLQQGSDD